MPQSDSRKSPSENLEACVSSGRSSVFVYLQSDATQRQQSGHSTTRKINQDAAY